MAKTDEIATLVDEALLLFPYRDRELDAVKLARLKILYAEHLHQFPFESLRQALNNHVRKSTFFPTVKDFIDGILAISTLAEAVPDVDEAWTQAQEYARNLYERAKYDIGVKLVDVHPLVAETVKTLGYERIQQCLVPEQSTLYAQFRDLYHGIVSRHLQKQVMLPAYANHVKQLATQNNTGTVPQLSRASDEVRTPALRVETPEQSRQRVESDLLARNAAKAQSKYPSALSDESMQFLAKVLGKDDNRQPEIEPAHI